MEAKILLVEDHADSARVTAMLLRKFGYEIVVVGNCAQARAAVAIENPELVLCDIGLPDGDGLSLMRELKAQYQLTGIALSGSDDTADADRYRHAGFADVIAKPFKLDQLTAAIERAVFQPGPLSRTVPGAVPGDTAGNNNTRLPQLHPPAFHY